MNGCRRNNIVSGTRIIVALSSIHFTRGNSPRTVNGAKISAIQRGVPNQKELPIQIIKEIINPPIIAA
jgi:hypothetical protein